jgi:hypothetical protein
MCLKKQKKQGCFQAFSSDKKGAGQVIRKLDSKVVEKRRKNSPNTRGLCIHSPRAPLKT